MTIRDVAYKINQLAADYEMSRFQLMRKSLKSLSRVTFKIFTDQTIFQSSDNRYAYHWGGRKEIQYNIAYESDSMLFRYGLAFSLKPSPGLLEPLAILKPKIDRFNEFLTQNPEFFSAMKLWSYREGKKPPRSANKKVRIISDSLAQNGSFIFIGKYFKKTFNQLTAKDYKEILSTFDYLLHVYKHVEGDILLPQDKIARICWNSKGWRRPTGRKGKSENKKTSEYRHRYGHEEWLFDLEKTINGYHYGFLQPIHKNWKLYKGKVFNISLYAIDSEAKERWWIGTIKKC